MLAVSSSGMSHSLKENMDTCKDDTRQGLVHKNKNRLFFLFQRVLAQITVVPQSPVVQYNRTWSSIRLVLYVYQCMCTYSCCFSGASFPCPSSLIGMPWKSQDNLAIGYCISPSRLCRVLSWCCCCSFRRRVRHSLRSHYSSIDNSEAGQRMGEGIVHG
jgi:hypothetical protein